MTSNKLGSSKRLTKSKGFYSRESLTRGLASAGLLMFLCLVSLYSLFRNHSQLDRHLLRNRWLQGTLVEAAWGAANTRATYLGAQYHRLVLRHGRNRAIVAVAHTIRTIVYHMLVRGKSYQELGDNYFDQRQQQLTVRRAVRRIERLGYRVSCHQRSWRAVLASPGCTRG